MSSPLVKYLLEVSKNVLKKDSCQVHAALSLSRLHHDLRKWTPASPDLYDPFVELISPTKRNFRFSDTAAYDYKNDLPRQVQHYLNTWKVLEDMNSELEKAEAARREETERRRKLKQEAEGPVPIMLDRPKPSPRGIYLFGSVGTGKTMLMDMAFDCFPVEKKRRLHFHQFMQQAMDTLSYVSDQLKDDKSHEGSMVFSMQVVAKSFAEQGRLLCLDDVQVTDATTMTVLTQILGFLHQYGVVVLATSNRSPEDLYQGSVNSVWINPMVASLSALEVVSLHNDSLDYRRALERSNPAERPTFVNGTKLNELWEQLTRDAAVPGTVECYGRLIPVPQQHLGIARFSAPVFLSSDLGSADFLMIARSFHTVFLEDVPMLTRSSRREARRFIWLVDALYEAKAQLIATFEKSGDFERTPDNIFSDGGDFGEDNLQMEVFAEERSASFEPVTSSKGAAYSVRKEAKEWTSARFRETQNALIFSGQEEIFAAARCVSRLAEMGSKQYQTKLHLPDARAGQLGPIPLPTLLPRQSYGERSWMQYFRNLVKFKGRPRPSGGGEMKSGGNGCGNEKPLPFLADSSGL